MLPENFQLTIKKNPRKLVINDKNQCRHWQKKKRKRKLPQQMSLMKKKPIHIWNKNVVSLKLLKKL